MRISDWSSDVCSSDLVRKQRACARHFDGPRHPEICHHVLAPGVRDGHELRDQQNLHANIATALLGVCNGDGPVDVVDLPGLYGNVDRADLLRDGGAFRRSTAHTYELPSLMRISSADFC